MNCIRGARAVQESIIEGFPEADIDVLIVWTHILKGDAGDAAARKSSRIFDDPRVSQFHDGRRRVARAFAGYVNMPSMSKMIDEVGLKPGQVNSVFSPGFVKDDAAAFDLLMFFEADARWADDIPEPSTWMTQLDPDMFIGIDRHRFHWGPALVAELRREMTKRFPNNP